MSATPFMARGVQFEDISFASIGSPSSVAAPTSIDYLNAQLVAHGFTHGSGLNLSDLRGRDQQAVLKCLANMLGQRLDDMTRAEQLTVKFKTLSYDYERLVEQNRLSKEATSQAQKEMETGKAKAEAAQKRLTSEEEAHRKSKDDYQRLKLAMAYLRTTTSNDIKRKEKEIEAVMDKWSKMTAVQAKLGSIGSGLACANLLPEQQSQEEGSSIWEAALADSETARLRLVKENDALKDVIIGCANALKTLQHDTLASTTKVAKGEPELILSDVLFASDSSTSGPETAHEKLRVLFMDLRAAISKASAKGNRRRESMMQVEQDKKIIEGLQKEIEELNAQLQEAQVETRQQGQQLLEQFVTDARFMAGQRHVADMSMDWMGTPDKRGIAEALENQRKHLESERDKHTEAAIKLGKEKAALEAERLQFLEEKRKFGVASILDELPPTPGVPERVQEIPDTRPLAKETAALVPAPIIPAPIEIPPKSTTTLSQLKLEPDALAASTTPPFTEDELSPTSPTEQITNKLLQTAPSASAPPRAPIFSKPSISKPSGPPPSTLPPSLRPGQTTPVKAFQPGRMHRYSPAVPSPLSKIIRAESPPSSPESRAQKERRPPVIAEEDEEQENEPLEPLPEMPVVTAIARPITPPAIPYDGEEDEHDYIKPTGRPGSLSPLSRIMNMGLSPAIAPTLAIPSFPGLLGTGPLGQDLLGKGKQSDVTLGFSNLPGGFSLAAKINAQPLLPTAGKGPGKGMKTFRATVTATAGPSSRNTKVTAAPAKTTTAKGHTKQPSKEKAPSLSNDNQPRSSKESTSSSSDAGSSSGDAPGSGRSSSRASATSAGTKTTTKTTSSAGTGRATKNGAAVKGTREKENAKRPAVNTRPVPSAGPVKKPTTAAGASRVVTKSTINGIKKPVAKPPTLKAPKG